MFIDARNLGHLVNRRTRELSAEDIQQIADTYHNWRKLLSVMTHEIMNSIAPISSLADTLNYRLSALNNPSTDSPKIMSQYLLDDLQLGVETIQKRSEGLLKFAETYRNLNKITILNLKKVYARDLFENLYQLMHPTLEEKILNWKVS